MSQLAVLCPPSAGLNVESVLEPAAGVRGKYLRLASSRDQPRVIFWCYGGAFIGGDTTSNLGLAERWGRALSCDVFLADLGAYPEQRLSDIVRNACRCYEWLLRRVDPKRIVFFGKSSGGGAALLTLQMALAPASKRQDSFLEGGTIPMPAGIALYGPFVDYTAEGAAQMTENSALDLVVTPRIIEAVSPVMPEICGGEHLRQAASPLFQSMEGLCPMLVSTSQHESCWPSNEALVRRARNAGVEVALQNYPFQAHVFQMTTAFLPEAQQAEADTFAWIKRQWGED